MSTMKTPDFRSITQNGTNHAYCQTVHIFCQLLYKHSSKCSVKMIVPGILVGTDVSQFVEIFRCNSEEYPDKRKNRLSVIRAHYRKLVIYWSPAISKHHNFGLVRVHFNIPFLTVY